MLTKGTRVYSPQYGFGRVTVVKLVMHPLNRWVVGVTFKVKNNYLMQLAPGSRQYCGSWYTPEGAGLLNDSIVKVPKEAIEEVYRGIPKEVLCLLRARLPRCAIFMVGTRSWGTYKFAGSEMYNGVEETFHEEVVVCYSPQ